MKQIIGPAFALSLLAAPLGAQDSDPAPAPERHEGFSLMEEGARMLLRGLLSEMDPAIDELRGLADEIGPKIQLFAQEMGPAFATLMQQVDDFANYMPPEFMPNGDIIIRRRETAPEFIPPADEETGGIEL